MELWERPNMTAMRGVIREGSADVLVAYCLDRLSAWDAHIAILDDECERHGCRLEFATETYENTAAGKFVRSAKAFAAAVEHEKTLERTQRGRRARLESGRLISGFKVPYGYLWNADRSALLIDPVTAPVVQRIFAAIVRGETIRSIATSLTLDGIPRPLGGPIGWSTATVQWILKNPVYCGRPVGLRSRQERDLRTGHVRKVIRPESEQIPMPAGVAPALIDRETFEAIQRQLTLNKLRAPRNNHAPESALLRGGVARCGYCGWTLIVASRGRPDRPEGYVRTYICQRKHGLAADHCTDRPAISTHILDAAVWKHVEEILHNPELIAMELERMRGTSRALIAPSPTCFASNERLQWKGPQLLSWRQRCRS
jgi:site-specific DNA recombinase